MTQIAFLGAGNIAQAIMGGLIETGYAGNTIHACDPAPACQEKARALGANVTANNDAAIAEADVVILCVKPNVVVDLLAAVSVPLDNKLVISVAAGVTVASIAGAAPAGTAIVRCMPNTPALVKTGMTAMFANEEVSPAQQSQAEAILAAVGQAIWVDDESQLDAVTAVSGSGPAYFFLMMEAMIDAACSQGLDKQTAKTLVLQTALGAARMAVESVDDPARLRHNVTSPGGTTQAAIESFQAAGYADIVEAAVDAARRRSVELSADS